MIFPDVNVLVYAVRSDAKQHDRYRRWLEDVINAPQAYGMSPQVLATVVCISTHPKIFTRPSKPGDAFAFCQTLLKQPNVAIIVPGERHWGIFREVSEVAAAATGNLIQDAWLAALAIESGCEWITIDRDFARFPGLTWRTRW